MSGETTDKEYQQEPLNILEGYQGIQVNRNLVRAPTNRILIGTPTLGSVRMEWAMSRFGLTIPCNWSQGVSTPFVATNAPVGYLVADAQNIIVRDAIEGNYDWLLLIEDDTCPPPDALIRVNDYIKKGDIPVVSGLYYQKAVPTEPLIYRGGGTGAFDDFMLGDMVWCDGIPTGFFLCNMKVMKILWDESAEYMAGNVLTRRVFEQPANVWFDEELGMLRSEGATSDLAWCKRVIDNDVLRRAGWPKIGKKKYPFVVDTNIFCRHIAPDGTMYPPVNVIPNVRKRPARR